MLKLSKPNFFKIFNPTKPFLNGHKTASGWKKFG